MLAVTACLALIGCTSGPAAAPTSAPTPAPSASPVGHVITGTFQYPNDNIGCATLTTVGELDGIGPTTQVSLTDESGMILAVTQLGPTTFPGCFFRFTFGQVLEGPKFYSVQVAQRGKITDSAAQLAATSWHFRLPAGIAP